MSGRVKTELLNDWNAVRYFVIVVCRGGFTMTARSLGIKPESLRKKVSLLGKLLRTPLFTSASGQSALTGNVCQLCLL